MGEKNPCNFNNCIKSMTPCCPINHGETVHVNSSPTIHFKRACCLLNCKSRECKLRTCPDYKYTAHYASNFIIIEL